MSWQVGDSAFIKHSSRSLYGGEIVIPVTIDAVGTGPNLGKYKVSSEHQKNITVTANMLIDK